MRTEFECVTPDVEEGPVEADAFQAVFLAIIISSLGGGAGLLLGRRRAAPPPATSDAYADILRNLQDAKRRFCAGEDPRSVVLYCYQEMLDTLGSPGRIEATALTPREFALQLQRIGLSDASVVRLTHLFEVVRYADRPNREIAEAAVACLDSIRMVHSS